MSPWMIILLVLILIISNYNQTAAHGTKQHGKRSFLIEKNDRNVSLLERINFVTLNVSKNEKDPSAMQRNRLRQDLQHLLSSMVKKIIYKRRSKQVKRPESGRSGGRIYAGKAAIDNKKAIGDFPEGNRLEVIENGKRDRDNYGKTIGDNSVGIREQASRDISRVEESLMRIIRRSVNPQTPKVRSYRDESWKLGINSSDVSGTGRSLRGKRASDKDAWMKRDFEDHETSMKMHAFVVRDEDIPPCCSPAKEVTNQRYFMCSGAVLTLKHAITTASCIHYADIYEQLDSCVVFYDYCDVTKFNELIFRTGRIRHHVDADLAILVGATSPRAYVIKINRYEMHPDYDYDVDSKDHATHNVAILYLACSIVEDDVVVPSLPKGYNDDVAHMCCREGCDLITVVQSFDNRHTAKILPAKHLPAPRHDDDVPNYRQLPNSPFEATRRFHKQMFGANESFPLSRRIRSPVKLAAAPIFFGKEPRSLLRLPSSAKPGDTSMAKKRKKAKSLQASRVKSQPRERKRKKPLNLNDVTNGRRPAAAQIPILRALEAEGVNVEEQLAAVDWEKIEETMSKKFSDANREKMDLFAKNVVDETMRRLETVVGDDGGVAASAGSPADPKLASSAPRGNGSIVFEKLMPGDSRNRSIDSFVKVFTKVVTSLVPPNSLAALSVPADSSVEEKDLKDPPPLHAECPPLGSPIFIDETLVGLLAYTCDDVQNWVEWKYVNIAKNMNWIRSRISMNYEPAGTCGRTENVASQQQRSLPDEMKTVFMRKKTRENSTERRRDRKVEWPSREILEDKRRIDFIGNPDDARISVTEASARIFQDSWPPRNSRLAPRQPSADGVFADSPIQPKASIENPKPMYNVNTCYVKPDGTIDCQSQRDFDIR